MKKPVIGILGAGKLGVTLARLMTNAGYKVLIANSKGPDSLTMIMDVLVPQAQPVAAEELITEAEVVILAIPLSKYVTLDQRLFEGKLVLDAMNYWWEVDGKPNTISDLTRSSSEVVQDYLAGSLVAKAFNHMGYHDLEMEADKTGADKRVIAYATDHESLRPVLEMLIQDTGFIPLDLGALKQGLVLEPGSPLFGADLTLSEFQAVIDNFYSSDFGKAIIAARDGKIK